MGRKRVLESAMLSLIAFICLFTSVVTASIPSIVNPSAVYNTAQVAPANEYFEGYQEQIDPATGALVVTQTDFSLPGRNGLDFELKRIYRSNMAGMGAPRVEDVWDYDVYYYYGATYLYDYDQTYDYDYYNGDYYTETSYLYFTYYPFDSVGAASTTNGMYHMDYSIDYDTRDDLDDAWSDDWSGTGEVCSEDIPDIESYYSLEHSVDESLAFDPYGFGLGWTLSLPMIKEIDGITFLSHENGSTYKIEGSVIQNYDLKDLSYAGDSSFYSGAWQSRTALTRADGKKWFFDPLGRLLGITNRFNDAIKFEYDSYSRISQVFDTVQRKIEFVYDNYPASTITVSVYAPLGTNPQTWQSTAATTWVYSLTPIASSTLSELTQVTPPIGLPINYEYTLQNAAFLYSPYIENYSYSGPGSLGYLNMTSIDNPTMGSTYFEYVLLSEIFETNDPWTSSYDNYIESFRANRRYDSLPTSHFALNQSETITTQISGDSRFVYGDMTVNGFDTTRTEYNGTTPGLVEKWYFNVDYIQEKREVIVDGAGADRLQTETVRETREEIFKQLPIETHIETCYGASCGSASVTKTAWTNQGQLVKSLSPDNQLVMYTYDLTYGLMTSKIEVIDQVTRQSRVTEYVLDAAKKNVIEERQYFGQLGATEVELQAVVILGAANPGFPWEWLIDNIASRGEVKIDWGHGMWSAYVNYTLRWEEVGNPTNYYTTTVNHDNGIWSDSGTDTIALNFPSPGLYKVTVTNNCSAGSNQQVNIVSGTKAWGPAYIKVPGTDSSLIKYEYSTTQPGQLTKATVYEYDGTTEASNTDFTYEGIAVAPSTMAQHETSTNVTVTTKAEYDSLGRTISYLVYDNAMSEQAKTCATSTFTYDGIGRITSAHLATQAVTATCANEKPTRTWQYLDSQRRIRFIDELNHYTEVVYDGLGRTVAVMQPRASGDPNLVASQQVYDAFGRVASQYDALFNATTYEYDEAGRKIRTTYPDQTLSQAWYLNSNTTPVTTPALSLTPPSGYSGSAWVRWEKVEDELGNPAYTGYDAVNRVVWTAVNPRTDLGTWEITWTEYDVLNRVIGSYIRRDTSTGWEKTSFTYNNLGDKPISMDLPGAEPTHTYAYNSRELKVTEDSGATSISWQYDMLGRPTIVTYPNNTTTQFTYGKEGQLNKTVAEVKASGVAQNRVTTVNNLRGWMIEEKTELLLESPSLVLSMKYEYDDAGNPTKIIYPPTEEQPEAYVSLSYNTQSLLKMINSDAGYIVANGANDGLIYNANGMPVTAVLGNGIRTDYTYDTRSRLTGIISDPLSLGYSYYNNSNVQSVSQVPIVGASLVNNFTETNTTTGWSTASGTGTAALSTQAQRNGVNIRTLNITTSGDHMYWSDMQEVDPTADYEVRLSIYSAHVDATGTRYFGVYVYDANQVLLSVTPFDVSTRTWGAATNNPYFWNGDVYGGNWRDMVAYLVGCNTSADDIPAGKNVSTHFKLPANAKFVRVRFLNYYNSGVTVSNDFFSPSLVKTQLANTDLEYEYDKVGRLTSAQHWTASGVVATAYEYDLAGNRVEETVGGGTPIDYVYSSGNYLVSRGGASNTYGWGNYGQLVSKVRDSVNYSYTYDDRRLLNEVKVGLSSAGTYIYDAAGRRVKSTEGTVSTVTLYLGNDVIYEINGVGTTNKVYTRYIPLNGKYVAKLTREGEEGAWAKYYYHTDIVGSTRAQTDGTGAVVARFDYEAFGEVSQQAGSAADELHRFTGKPMDGTGLYYFNARYMDPEIGRFISRDPAMDGLNWYLYASGNPLIYVDPDGQFAKIYQKGNYIHIIIPITYTGEGATPEVIAAFNAEIVKQWSGTFGEYEVKTEVVTPAKGDFTNSITLDDPSPLPSYVDLPAMDSGVWDPKEYSWVAAHEAGHLMGSRDHYDEWYDEKGKRHTDPKPGWDDNIMGEYWGKVEEKNIIEILENPNNVME